MEWQIITTIGIALFNVLMGLIMALMARKDAQQGKFIEDLYDKHTKDADKLQALELEIAKNYHPKSEIQAIVSNLQKHLDERFDRIERHMGIDRRVFGGE